MSLIVQKFGGTSVANTDLIMNAANIITGAYNKGNNIVAIVSAQGDMTDQLIDKAKKINKHGSKREMDVLLSAGEQISIALLSMAIEKLGYPVVSLLGWQAGVMTSSNYGSALIKKINPDRIKKELDKKNIVIIAGFQGLNEYHDVTTLGRGGSDTSAVGIAASLNADLCQIFTDVDGVFTADPRKVPTASKIDSISYDEMLELAALGAQVLNNRSVEIAKRHNIVVEVLSSFSKKRGTIVKETASVEKILISGVAKDNNIARISIIGIPDVPGWDFKIFSKLASKNIKVDIILQSIGKEGNKDITLTVKEEQLEDAVNILTSYCESINKNVRISYDSHVSKVSIVGAGIETHPDIAAKMFEALFSLQINIQMIATSEIKISVLIDQDKADQAVSAIHETFFESDSILK